MAEISFGAMKKAFGSSPNRATNFRKSLSRMLLAGKGVGYHTELQRQRSRENADAFKEIISNATPSKPTPFPVVGIVGGGFAGLYAGLILQSLGIESEVFESTDRVGGRIKTWYSTDYSPNHTDRSSLYGEVGGMRLPQYSEDMLPVQQLALAVNTVLERNGLDEQKVTWRKFYYDSDVQRLRFNNMSTFVTLANSNLNSLNFDELNGGDIPQVWFTTKKDASGNEYLPINQIMGKVVGPFVDQINNSFAQGFDAMMQFDMHSMWDYLSNIFTVGDLEEYYDPALGGKSDLLPWSVVSYLETTNVGTNMDLVSFVEMVIAVYDWGGSKNPYKPGDESIYMLTVDQGMQRFPNACKTVLNLAYGVTPEDGQLAQVQIGMVKDKEGNYTYSPPNLTPDAQPEDRSTSSYPAVPQKKSRRKQRVFLNHKVVGISHDTSLYKGHGGMNVKVKQITRSKAKTRTIDKQYPYVISTLPFGAYLNGELKENLLNNLSFSKAQAIRECNYMSAFKAFITFKTQFWADLGKRQDMGLGVAATDRPIRQIVYPSYGYPQNGDGPKGGVLQIYCWAEDAKRLGALSDEERVNECLKGIAYLYPDADVYGSFAGYHDGNTTKTWFWDQNAGGGAFALFAPEQFKNIYPTLLTPEFDGCLQIAGECSSVHHGWIVGALDSAYNAVLNILMQAKAYNQITKMQETWGMFNAPDVAPDASTMNELGYRFQYNEVDRNAASIPPNQKESIYGTSQYVFNGTIPAFIEDYDKVPQSMKNTLLDKKVLDMLNDLWNDNVAQRAAKKASNQSQQALPPNASAVEILESIYYGDNFQAIPKPMFWLKDDDEFARQQTGGFMPDYLTKVSQEQLKSIIEKANIPNVQDMGPLEQVQYVADYRQFLEACTVIPVGFYLAKPIIFFKVNEQNELMPVGIQLEASGQLFTPQMPNAANAWLLAKMQTNCAAQSLHDVCSHQLLTHQICAMVSISLFSEEVFAPMGNESGPAFQTHPVFRLLRPHLVKTVEFMQTIYNSQYNPNASKFPETRVVNGKPGVYNIGFVYDLIFSCGRIGNYQLQDKVYNNENFRFLDLAITVDSQKRGVNETPFSYPYVHDATLWYHAISSFINDFVDTYYKGGDAAIASDAQLQRFFNKLIPVFNHVEGSSEPAKRFPEKVVTSQLLKEVLTMFVWQFSVQHTVVNDGAYDMAAFVPNASTLMNPLPNKPSAEWTPQDVVASMPDQNKTYPELGGMNFMDIQINASVTGQGPYPETIFGRGVLEPSIDFLQDLYGFVEPDLRKAVDAFYQEARKVGGAIQQRQWRDTAHFLECHTRQSNVPNTVIFDLISPINVMTSILT